MVRLLAIGAVAAVGITGAVAAFGDDDTRGEVVRVIDGDTLVARIDGDDVRVRLLNIDTPETKDPDEPVQCMGPEATAFLQKRLPVGTEIELEYDEERSDRYDRTLAGVFESGSLVNAEIAAEGLGLPVLFEPNDRFLDQVTRASQTAERDKKGLFDPAAECSLPARAQQIADTVGAVPAQVDGDPADALAQAEDALAEVDSFVEVLDSHDFSSLGNTVFATSTMTSYIGSMRAEAGEQRDSAEQKRADLEKAKDSYDDTQKQKRQETERAELEAQEEKAREARASQSTAQEPRPAQRDRTTQRSTGTSGSSKTSSSQRSPSSKGSTDSSGAASSSGKSSRGSTTSKRSSSSSTSRTSDSSRAKSSGGSSGRSHGSSSSRRKSSSAPSTSPNESKRSNGSKGSSSSKGSKGSSSSKGRSGSFSSKSSCTPYGPEIPYSSSGGYTGKRYGMPGGKTFRKCR